ncbi:unannotated protein [freshwater metagenome]|uniref:Unannotated protein n=1 Tax=freshwater metagenome TaxID=449393 RepID=A0A6J7J8K5_9ZZZZ
MVSAPVRVAQVSVCLGIWGVLVDARPMSTQQDVVRRPWEMQSGGPRKGLARRAELLAWMLEAPENQGVSAKEIAQRCPVYVNVAPNPYVRVLKDLNNMAEIECTIVGSRNRPVQWSVTALGAQQLR